LLEPHVGAERIGDVPLAALGAKRRGGPLGGQLAQGPGGIAAAARALEQLRVDLGGEDLEARVWAEVLEHQRERVRLFSRAGAGAPAAQWAALAPGARDE